MSGGKNRRARTRGGKRFSTRNRTKKRSEQQPLILPTRPLIQLLEDRCMLAADITTHTDFTQSGPLEIEIGGTTPGVGGHDQHDASGTATLNGQVDIKLIDGFVPQAGQSFEIIKSSSIAGEFTGATGLYGFGDGSLYFDLVEQGELAVCASESVASQRRCAVDNAECSESARRVLFQLLRCDDAHDRDGRDYCR